MGDEIASAAPADASSGDMTWDLFVQKAKEIYDGSGDANAKASGIKKLAQALFKLSEKIDDAASAASEAASGSEAGGNGEGTPATESVKPAKSAGQKPPHDTGDKYLKAIEVLESVGIHPNALQIKTVAAFDGDLAVQKSLAESWKQSAGAPAQKTKPRSVPANAMESTGQQSAGQPADRKKLFADADRMVFGR